jgi:hypothetical protein
LLLIVERFDSAEIDDYGLTRLNATVAAAKAMILSAISATISIGRSGT